MSTAVISESGSIIESDILYASSTGSTQNDSSLINGQVLGGIYTYGTLGVHTVYTVNTTIAINAGTIFDAGSFATLDLATAISTSLLTHFQIGEGFTAPPGGTSVPSGNGTLEFGLSTISLALLSTTTFYGTNDKLVFDSATAAPTVVTNFLASDTIDFKEVAFATGDHYVNNPLAPGVYNSAGNRVATISFNGTTATGSIIVVNDGSGGTLLEFACFAAGTRIDTPDGRISVEDLRAGETVLLASGGTRAVEWIGRRRIDLHRHANPEMVRPIRIMANAIADGIPRRDLRISPDHALFIDGKLIPARLLRNGTTVLEEHDCQSVTYFHVELDAHDVLLAEGLPAESYLDTGNRSAFENAGLPVMLHPEFNSQARREAESCAPLVCDATRVEPVWKAIADRAEARGFALPRAETTADPDLSITIGGRRYSPSARTGSRYTFVLPRLHGDARLSSLSIRPSTLFPWIEDRRQLGVYVERIVLHNTHNVREIAVDDPRLSQGWWAAEWNGVTFRRWTDGDAALPLPPVDGPVMLEIQASSSGMVYLGNSGQPRLAA
jgi:Hint domain